MEFKLDEEISFNTDRQPSKYLKFNHQQSKANIIIMQPSTVKATLPLCVPY